MGKRKAPGLFNLVQALTVLAPLFSIQYLRGAAALLVVLYHIIGFLFRVEHTNFRFEFLSAGVDIFFVISGFIMWYTTFNGNVGTAEFLKHRLIRIVPLYWLITTFYLVVLLIKPNWMQSAQFELFHVVSSYLFIPAAHPVVAQEMWPLVVPGWTLNCEMFFYVLFGFALVLSSRARLCVVVAVLVCVVSLQALNPPVNSIIGFYSSSIMLEFALGVALGYLFTNGASIPRLPSVLIILVGLISLVIPSTLNLQALLPRAILFGCPAFLVVAGAVFYERAHNLPKIALPKLLGDASYSLYLSHGAVLSAFEQFWRKFSLPLTFGPMAALLFSLASIIIAIIFGIALYHFVERPLRKKLSARIKRNISTTSHRLPAV